MKAKKNKPKYFHPRRRAELSLQFYRDKERTPNFLITSNPKVEGQDFCTGVDTLIFAENLVNNGCVSLNELIFLCEFFDAVKRAIREKFKESPVSLEGIK